jgi:hypothetical protein
MPKDCDGCLRMELKALWCGQHRLDWLALNVNCWKLCPYDKSKQTSWMDAYRKQVLSLWEVIQKENCWYQTASTRLPQSACLGRTCGR